MSGVFFGGVYLYQLLCNRSFKKGGWLIFECMGVFSRDYGISTAWVAFFACMILWWPVSALMQLRNTVDYGGYGGPCINALRCGTLSDTATRSGRSRAESGCSRAESGRSSARGAAAI